jgi:hypothetical protein
MLDLSILIPIHNESKIIENNLLKIKKFMDKNYKYRWNFLIILNGCTDDSYQILIKLKKKIKNIEICEINKGDYGNALRKGLLISNSKKIFIINIEQYDMNFFLWANKKIKYYDFIIGSKTSDITINEQSKYRRFLTWGLNSILSLIFKFNGTDTHGIKLIKMSNRIRRIILNTKLSRGQFDTELTIKIIREGYWVAEGPMKYKEQRPPKNFMIKKILQNVIDLFRLYKILKDYKVKKINFRRYCLYDVENLK